MPKPPYIELGPRTDSVKIPILYEDRSVLAIDKPAGWMLVPFSWQKTNWNLQAAITSSIAVRDFWASSRNLKFLRHIHRLDAETTGVLLFSKSQGGVETFGDLFEGRRMEKVYLAVIPGVPAAPEWSCTLKLAQDPQQIGRIKVDPKFGKDAETHFKLLDTHTHSRLGQISLVEAHPVTGRTHQIRVHLAKSAQPIIGDDFYGAKHSSPSRDFPIALRSISLSYTDPFTKKRVRISAPTDDFVRAFGFKPLSRPPKPAPAPTIEQKPTPDA